MPTLARFVIAHRWLVLAGWLVLAAAGVVAAPRATSALSYSFSLPGQAGYQANQQIERQFGSGGQNAPVLLVVTKGGRTISVVDGRAWQFETDSREKKLIATMTATVMTVVGRDDVRH